MPVLSEGTILKNGSFIIESLLASGGFGEVYLATQPAMHRQVAIKVLRPEVAGDATVLALFEREARAAGSLLHPHVLPVLDFGFDEAAGAHFLAMQYVPGGATLKQWLGTPRDPKQVARLVEGIASALDAAHARGILHRDVKPANVLLDPDGRPLLTDFGIARLDVGTVMTATGTRMGTALYMAPERWTGEPSDAKSDQYALAVVTFELLAGRPPFIGDEVALLGQHLMSQPPSLLQFNPEISPSIDQAVARGLRKAKEERYATCTEFWRALNKAVEADRLASLSSQYRLAVQLLDSGRSDEALAELESINRERPGYRDVEALLDRIQDRVAPVVELAAVEAAPPIDEPPAEWVAAGASPPTFWTPARPALEMAPAPTSEAVPLDVTKDTPLPSMPLTDAPVGVEVAALEPIADPSSAAGAAAGAQDSGQASDVSDQGVARRPLGLTQPRVPRSLTGLPHLPLIAAAVGGIILILGVVAIRAATGGDGAGSAAAIEVRVPPTGASSPVASPAAAGSAPSPLALAPTVTLLPEASSSPSSPQGATISLQDAWTLANGEVDGVWGRDWDRAVTLLDSFLEQNPGHAAASDRLYGALVAQGRELISEGEVTAARDVLVRAQSLAPQREEAASLLRSLTPTPEPTEPPAPTAVPRPTAVPTEPPSPTEPPPPTEVPTTEPQPTATLRPPPGAAPTATLRPPPIY